MVVNLISQKYIKKYTSLLLQVTIHYIVSQAAMFITQWIFAIFGEFTLYNQYIARKSWKDTLKL
jgi:hypothetical protein